MSDKIVITNENEILTTLLTLTLALLVRWSVSLNTYSGYGKPPMYGDYEAQRHWMEITANLPVHSWYKNSLDNDLLYWGLDYPPLSAYHSYLNGKAAESINGSWNTLHISRGLEDQHHKLFMRFTVLACDLLLYIPLVALFFFRNRAFHIDIGHGQAALACLCALLDPSIILVDHGHFQYNCASLGLALWAAYAISKQKLLVAAALFCFALNYKQMELYHSVPFFVYLLKHCYQQNNVPAKLSLLFKLGLTVIISFTISWLPFFLLCDKEGLIQILRRIFPFNRGLFEDKVANVWCSLHPILRLKEAVDQTVVVRLCLGSTVLSIIPDCVLLWRSATPKNLLLGLSSTSLSFFLFSYHVHEKSILLATAPASLLLLHYPHIMGWFILIATGSMFPLLHKDGLALPTISLVILFLIILRILIDSFTSDEPVLIVSEKLKISTTAVSVLTAISTLGMVLLCELHLAATPPERFPDLFTYFISTYACGHFLFFKICILILMGSGKQLKKS